MAYNKSPFKMAGKSPQMKQLIGKQSTLPEGLQAAIKASPAKKYGHSPAKQLGKDEKSSPAKQVRVKDLPKKAVETGEKILEGGKKFIKSIGNIKLISKARQDCKKAGGKYSKKEGCFMPEDKKKEAK